MEYSVIVGYLSSLSFPEKKKKKKTLCVCLCVRACMRAYARAPYARLAAFQEMTN